MSQLIACRHTQGIALAADSKAVDFDPQGNMIHLKVNRMIPLTQHTAILAGGAADGVDMCQALRNFISEEGLDDIQDIYGAALPFLATEFDRFMRKRCEVLPVDPVHHVYFVLAGYTEKDSQRPFRLYLLWTKKKLPRLDGEEIDVAYSAPRVMGLEYRLNRLSQENAPLDRILAEMRRQMEAMASNEEEIGPPFSYALITPEGFQRRE